MLDYNGQLYLLWSGWHGDVNVTENIYIAKMKDSITIDAPRILISTPTYSWENQGPAVNEAPEAIKTVTARFMSPILQAGAGRTIMRWECWL